MLSDVKTYRKVTVVQYCKTLNSQHQNLATHINLIYFINIMLYHHLLTKNVALQYAHWNLLVPGDRTTAVGMGPPRLMMRLLHKKM